MTLQAVESTRFESERWSNRCVIRCFSQLFEDNPSSDACLLDCEVSFTVFSGRLSAFKPTGIGPSTCLLRTASAVSCAPLPCLVPEGLLTVLDPARAYRVPGPSFIIVLVGAPTLSTRYQDDSPHAKAAMQSKA